MAYSYLVKSVFVNAVQWDRSDKAERAIEKLIGSKIELGDRYPGESNWPHWEFCHDGKWYHFHVGDWVVRDIFSHIKIMSNDQFREMFWVDED